jgi:uncharacterized protein (DUF2461 family)
MREHLIKAHTVETAIRDRLQTENALVDNSAKRVLVDLIGIRIETIDKLLADIDGGHPSDAFTGAMERIRAHFDKESKEPYKAWRGATPVDQPSLAKDILIVFEQLQLEGVYTGDAPKLDPRWNPTSKGPASA